MSNWAASVPSGEIEIHRACGAATPAGGFSRRPPRCPSRHDALPLTQALKRPYLPANRRRHPDVSRPPAIASDCLERMGRS